MQRLFALVELLDEFLDAILVIKLFRLSSGLAFVRENNFQTRIQKRQLAQSLRNDVCLELHRLAEDFFVRQERDQRAGVLRLADDMKFLNRLAALKLHVM